MTTIIATTLNQARKELIRNEDGPRRYIYLPADTHLHNVKPSAKPAEESAA